LNTQEKQDEKKAEKEEKEEEKCAKQLPRKYSVV